MATHLPGIGAAGLAKTLAALLAFRRFSWDSGRPQLIWHFLAVAGFVVASRLKSVAQIHWWQPPGRLAENGGWRRQGRNPMLYDPAVSSVVEHVSVYQEEPMNLSVHTICLARARIKFGMVNVA